MDLVLLLFLSIGSWSFYILLCFPKSVCLPARGKWVTVIKQVEKKSFPVIPAHVYHRNFTHFNIFTLKLFYLFWIFHHYCLWTACYFQCLNFFLFSQTFTFGSYDLLLWNNLISLSFSWRRKPFESFGLSSHECFVTNLLHKPGFPLRPGSKGATAVTQAKPIFL